MAFPTGWGRKCVISIQSSKISATLTDYTVKLTEVNFPSEMLDADGANPCRTDGGDIRFSSDAAGTTELPVHVKYISLNNDPALSKIQVYVKVASVSSSADTDIYVWYDAPSETLPAATATYGSEAAYPTSIWWGVYYCTTSSFLDETANSNDGTAYGTGHTYSTETGCDFPNVNAPSPATAAATLPSIGAVTSGTVLADVTPDDIQGTGENNYIFGHGDIDGNARIYLYIRGNGTNGLARYRMGSSGTSPGSINLSDNTRYAVGHRWSSGTQNGYVDGAADLSSDAFSGTPGSTETDTALAGVGQDNSAGGVDEGFDGEIHALWISKTDIGDAATKAYGLNWSDPATFAIEGTPGPAATGGPTMGLTGVGL